MSDIKTDRESLPEIALDFINKVVKKVRYRKKIRQEVREELTDHFYMALKDCRTDDERHTMAVEVIGEFGDVKVLASLIRRGKKRCRSLWRTIVARTFMAIGLSILIFVLYCIWFFTGKPSPSIDYVELFNERAKPAALDTDNAWPYYKRAIDLYVTPDEKVEEIRDKLLDDPELKISDLPAEDKEAYIPWFNENEAALTAFSTGAEKQYCFREYGFDEPSNDQEHQWLISIMMPHLSELKDLSRLAVLRSKLTIERGDNKEAIDNCVTLLNVARHWQKRATLIESLVGMSICQYGVTQAIQIADECELSLEELATAYRQMSVVFADGYPQIDFGGERLFTLDVIQHCFTDGGPGGGHLVPKNTFMLVGREVDMQVIGGSLLHAGRNKTLEKVKEVYDRFEDLAIMSPYDQKVGEVSFDRMLKDTPEYRYRIIHIMVPALGKVCRFRYENEAVYKAALTIYAIKRYQLAKGTLPVNLDTLVKAGFLGSVPDDPFSVGSLVYRVEGDDFILYSVGEDFVDGGGVAGTRKGKYKLWGDDGDAVFWPVQKKTADQ